LGTDFPHETGDVFLPAVDCIADPGIIESEVGAVLWNNSTALFAPPPLSWEKARSDGYGGMLTRNI
jgi:hypothetical protein